MEENLSRIVKIVLGIVIAIILFTIILSATGVLQQTAGSLETLGGDINESITNIGNDLKGSEAPAGGGSGGE